MILLYTCVISELAKPVPDPAVVAWIDALSDDALRLSVLTRGEITPVDEAVALRWGQSAPQLGARVVCGCTGAVVVSPWDSVPR